MEAQRTLETIHLSDYFKVISKRRQLVVAVLVVTVSVTLLFSFLMKPVYQASSVMVIDKQESASPITGEKMDIGSYQSELLTFNTHFKLIKSKPVVLEVIRELKLDNDKEEMNTSPLLAWIKRFKENIKLLLKSDAAKATPQDKIEGLVNTMKENINIQTTRETRLLTISAKNTNPELASNIANTLARKYIEFDTSSRMSTAKENLAWMHNELYTLKKKLEDDEQAFLDYKKMQNVFSIEGKQKVIDQKISGINTEYLTSRNRRLELDAKLGEIDKQIGQANDIIHVRSILANAVIDSIYANLTNLEMEANKLSKVYKQKHPKIVQITSEIEKIKIKLQSELRKEVDSLRTERAVLFTKEQAMEKNIGQFEEDALDAGSKELRFTILQRNVTTSQNLYDSLLARVKETTITNSGSTSNIRIVETASVPLSPVKPNKKKNLLLSIILGLFGGIGLAFFFEYLDQSVRTEDDVQNYLGLPVLSVIPIADYTDKQEASA